MMRNARVATFNVFELLRKTNKGRGGVKITPRPPPLNEIRRILEPFFFLTLSFSKTDSL